WWAAYSRPENRRFTPEEMMQMMAPPAAKSSRAPRPDGGILTLADLPSDVVAPEAPATPAGPADGSLGHFELPARDFNVEQDFYGKVFGWQFQSMGDVYLLFQTPGGEGGGFTKDYTPGDGGGTFYIYAADVAPKLAEVEAAGGTVVLKTTGVPGYGWIATFKDPQGNRVGLFSAKNPPAGESPVPAMPKMELPNNYGHIAHFTDPSGVTWACGRMGNRVEQKAGGQKAEGDPIDAPALGLHFARRDSRGQVNLLGNNVHRWHDLRLAPCQPDEESADQQQARRGHRAGLGAELAAS
ncbi:MAG: VOC family protein, partial [Armatimonadota bacterium]